MLIKNTVESLSGYDYVLDTNSFKFVINCCGKRTYETVLYGLKTQNDEQGLLRDMDFINRSNPSHFRAITKQVMEDYRRKDNGN